MIQKKILIYYDYFKPAYKAGGPIQSLSNLINHLGNLYDFYIYTSNYDLDNSTLSVVPDKWLELSPGIKILYSSKKVGSLKNTSKHIQGILPDIIYINGLYSLKCVFWPILYARTHRSYKGKIVIAPRGMLSPDALAIRWLKKRFYLILLKKLLVEPRTIWHATSQGEKDAIENFDDKARVVIASNIPNIHKEQSAPKELKISSPPLRLVTIAVISPMKNIDKVIKALSLLNFEVEYDLYGPIKDQGYWRECLQLSDQLPKNIRFNYCNEINPNRVAAALLQYHVYIQPSQSENFGHSIFEALQVGLPVVTSHGTPWARLEESAAGLNVTPEPKMLAQAFERMNQSIEEGRRFKSKEYIKDYLLSIDYRNMYKNLFKV